MVQCLTDSQVILFLDTQLPPHEAADVEAHLDQCQSCRQVIATMIRSPLRSAQMASVTAAPFPAGNKSERSLAQAIMGGEGTLAIHFLPGQLVDERYLVLDELGAGVSGVVYSAYDRKLDRKLALKFLSPGAYDQTERSQLRLVREGQSLARLSHPNVVAIHDIGAFAGCNYIAMEMVEGQSLRQWLAEQLPPWQRTVAVFLDAARGLLAAHNAGLVHRDFKPDNVLIGRDGRARVADFGLSHLLTAPVAPDTETALARVEINLPSPPSTVAGTPAYMAPEQYYGQAIDGRADQFSFCCALYEALYGVRPFRGDTPEEIMQAVMKKRILAPPSGRGVPSVVHAAVLRGLRMSPAERFPSMAPLCDVLSRSPQRRRMQLAGGLVGLLLLCALATGWQLRPKPCRGAAARLSRVWDQAQKQAAMQAFKETGVPYATAAWLRLRQQLDTYAAQWTAAHTEACEAASVRHEISPALLDQRMRCLDLRLHELHVTAELLSHADATLVERAEPMATRLRSVADCSSAMALDARVSPPPPAIAAQVKALRQQVTELKVLERAGRYQQSLELARAVAKESAAVGDQSLVAEVGVQLGSLEDQTGDPAHAAETLRTALSEAEASQHDEAVLAAWLGLARVALYSQSRYEQAADYLQHAQAFTARAGNDRARTDFFELQAALFRTSGKLADAERATEQAHASATRAYGAVSPQAATFLSRLAGLQILRGDTASALLLLERARKITVQALSPMHPAVIPILSAQADVLNRASRYEESLLQKRHALLIAEQAYPPTHVTRQKCLYNLLVSLSHRGQYAEAESVAQRWLAVDAQMTEHNPGWVLGTLQALAVTQYHQGRPAEAMATLRRAQAKQDELRAPDGQRGEILTDLADYELSAGQVSTALSHYQQAAAFQEKSYADRGEFGVTLTGIGKAYILRKEPAKAVPYLERALLILQKTTLNDDLRRGPHFALAQALVDSGGERDRARRLAEEARAIWQICGSPCRNDLALVTKWLKQSQDRQGS